MKARFPGFKKCMAMMRKHNPQTQEEEFHSLLPHAAEYVNELIEEFGKEMDTGLRCWLLELIGAARSPQAFDFLVGQLGAKEERLRELAISALEELNSKEARKVRWPVRASDREPKIDKGEIKQRVQAGGGRSLIEILADLEKRS
jgi:hypothetical protein